jgi:hypothetical protein
MDYGRANSPHLSIILVLSRNCCCCTDLLKDLKPGILRHPHPLKRDSSIQGSFRHMLSAMAGCVLRGIVFSIAEEEAPSVLSTEYHGHGSSPSPFGTQQQVLLPIWNPPLLQWSS